MKKIITGLKYIVKLGIGVIPFLRFYKKNLPDGIKINLRGLRYPVYLRSGTSDINTFIHIFYNEIYSIKERINPEVIIDCGANTGLASLYFKRRFANAQIIAIEPENSNFEVLIKNTCYYKGIKCFKKAVWNKKTSVEIYDPGIGHWGFITRESKQSNAVETITIDELMVQENLNRIDILKIDIEGAEKELFESNFDNWLGKTNIILIELHDHIKKDCSTNFLKAIEKHDFDVSSNNNEYICIKKVFNE
jgi:FkbM family methyltransferase